MPEEEKTNTRSEAGETLSTDSAAKAARPGKAQKTAKTQMPAINFATFIFSLNSSALVHLGIIDDPATGTKSKNLAMAKQTIDVLVMLQEKTRGNLTNDEENMLKSMLYDLRILYVKENG